MTNYSFRLTPGYCLYNGIAVLNQKGAQVTFLMEDLQNVELQKRLGRAFKSHVDYVNKQSDCPEIYKEKILINYRECNRIELKKAVSNFYKNNVFDCKSIAENSQIYGSENQNKESDEAAAILLLDTILNEARAKSVSDIHIEKNEVKFRIKGNLEKQMDLPEQRCLEVIQRIKLLSGMNVIENRKSQDGRFIFNTENPLFVRVSTVPVVGKNSFGNESVVLRLLDTQRLPLDFGVLGFNEKQIERMELFGTLKDGLLVICGPTGSGKSTTAATLLKNINKQSYGGKKIISLEDPPEFIIPGVTQIRVDENHENSFETLLNHIFRQDPDVIMIGEIRDEKSAAAALRASLTGHLVIATLHTSSVSGAFLRLENLGLERKMLSSVFRGGIIQELESIGEELVLMADVCFPKEGFSDKCLDNLSQNAIEDLFDSESNGSEVLAKSLEVMKNKQLLQQEVEEDDWENKEEVRLVSRKRKRAGFNATSNFGEVRKEA